MKKILMFVCLLVFMAYATGSAGTTNQNDSPQGSLTIHSSADLRGLMTKWTSRYQLVNPEVKLNYLSDIVEGKQSISSTGKDLSFVSNEFLSTQSGGSDWKMVVGRDAIVPVVNSKNPVFSEILQKGISPEKLSQLNNSGELSWGSLLGNAAIAPVHYYSIDNKDLNAQVSAFLKTDQPMTGAISVKDGKEMITRILNDPYAIGFCPLSDLLDERHQNFTSGISLIPIDKNGNGQLDSFEKIYGNVNDFLHGVWIGKFPGTLCRNIYVVASQQPDDMNTTAFLKWVLSDGQRDMNSEGYLDLGYNERQAKTDLLENTVNISQASDAHSANYTILLVIGIILLGGIATVFLLNRNARLNPSNKTASTIKRFSPDSLIIPKGLYFDKSHTWAFMEKTGMVRVGMDDFLTKVTGPLTRVSLKNPGDKIRKGEMILSVIQNGKHLNIQSPISGTIRISNASLNTFSGAINDSPYNEGWIYMIEPENWLRETEFLFMAEKYSSWIRNEFSRLKDFLASSTASHGLEYAHVVMQDGGELKENVLADLGPEIWEDFQTRFIEESH